MSSFRRFVPWLLLAGVAACNDTPAPGPWNLLLISIDTIRADRLGCYGYFRDTSPRLDKLARESIFFDRCIAPVAVTYPSHLSMMTGVYPSEHGSLGNVGDGGFPLDRDGDLRSLAEVLRDAGYATAGFVSAAPLKRYTGIHWGFDAYSAPQREQRTADETNRLAFEWLGDERDAPFFLWVHYFDPHSPYAPPEPYANLYERDEEQDAYFAERGIDTDPGIRFRDSPRLTVTEANNLYDGEIRWLDDQIGELLKWFRSRRDVWRRTVVVVVGDHGEGLGQHGMMTHGSIWSEQLWVPFMIRVPGREARRVERLVSVTDVAPTVLGLAELPDGADFLRQASGVDLLRLDPETEDVVFCQEGGSGSIRAKRDPQDLRRMMIDGGWKYVYDPLGEDELYRLDDDPHELTNVHSEHADVAASLRKRILDRIAAHAERRRALASPDSIAEPVVDRETIEQLRALGYVD